MTGGVRCRQRARCHGPSEGRVGGRSPINWAGEHSRKREPHEEDQGGRKPWACLGSPPPRSEEAAAWEVSRDSGPTPGGKLRLHTEVETQCTVCPVYTPHGRSWRPAWKIHTYATGSREEPVTAWGRGGDEEQKASWWAKTLALAFMPPRGQDLASAPPALPVTPSSVAISVSDHLDNSNDSHPI